MANEQVKNTLTQEYYGQSAPSQAARTNFSPGKPDARAGDENWPIDFRPAVAAVSQTLYYERVVKLSRGIVCDQNQTGAESAKESFAPEALENMTHTEERTGGDGLKEMP